MLVLKYKLLLGNEYKEAVFVIRHGAVVAHLFFARTPLDIVSSARSVFVGIRRRRPLAFAGFECFRPLIRPGRSWMYSPSLVLITSSYDLLACLFSPTLTPRI